ncbi:ATP-grasp domain-containing protein [Amycolatopsis anabasis]|uniref:ATP-grasp domain-containing protein n=1 Tax=Amycolatopsis anabasis TaxID=1840409 RepID=UPI00131A7357|nr:ATP-grasp domain-containing protein [Amycolatopsis anabasis]
MTIVFVEANSTGTTSTALRLAARNGYDTVFVTADRGFYARLPDNPLRVASATVTANTYDPLSVLRAIRHLDVEAVVSFDDYHLPIAAICARELRLPHAGLGGLLATRFKDVMRERTAGCAGAVDFHIIKPGTPPGTRLPYPVVVKPVDESGSVAVRRCDTDAELGDAVARFGDHVVNARGYRPDRSLLVERYAAGDEYSCELVWNPEAANWTMCGITRKLLGPEPHFVEVGHIFPAPLDHAVTDEVARRVATWLAAVELRCGAVHIEFRLTEAGPWLIEINPRLPGGHITELVRLCTGIDMVAAYLSFHLRDRGARLGVPRCAPQAATAATRHLLTSEVTRRGALTALRTATLPTLRRFEVVDMDPDRVSEVDVSNYDRPGYLLLADDDPDAVFADLTTADAALQPLARHLSTGSAR